jgi:pyoverdine/dityrosine biosynthesis protein Dit1|tara:strand:- start:8748 stop:9173 length:426 start_codon:yes stop_codon:yes gene_type:complete
MEQISDTLLLATFCKARNVRVTIDLIADSFEVVSSKVFVLQDESDRYKKILTYNIVKDETVFSDVIKNTISLHRKKEVNSLYTLNALNEVVKIQNNGVLDSKFSVEWEDYRNTLLVTYKEDDGEQKLRRINTRLISVVNID